MDKINENLFEEFDSLFGNEENPEKQAEQNDEGTKEEGKNLEDNTTDDDGEETEESCSKGESDDEMAAMLEAADKELGAINKEAGREQLDLANMMGLQEENPCKAEKPAARCAANPKKNKKSSTAGSSTPATPPKPKEPDNDLERLVVITNANEQRSFPAEMTLEQIREELEREFPAYTKENTNWYFEKQADRGRYLCIPNCKSNKAG